MKSPIRVALFLGLGLSSALAFFMAAGYRSNHQGYHQVLFKKPLPGQYIVAIPRMTERAQAQGRSAWSDTLELTRQIEGITGPLKAHPKSQSTEAQHFSLHGGGRSLKVSTYLKPLLQTKDLEIFKIQVKRPARSSQNMSQTLELLNQMPEVKWAAPNYRYWGDPRESFRPMGQSMVDPLLSSQYHHELIRSEEAWNWMASHSISHEVVIAMTDDGVDFGHEDLQGQFWMNSGEVPNNGIDDDQNGFIDDVRGWDFTEVTARTPYGDNDPSTPGEWFYHGTHLAGIIAAKAYNNRGGAGIAPSVKILPIRFYGDSPLTSEIYLQAYQYAVDSGAKIISTSYNIDGMVSDRVYHAALDYAYDAGVLVFNSAGNAGRENPARQVFNQLLLVCATIADQRNNDTKSTRSNYGVGIDLCAPGGGGAAGILSTVPLTNRYYRESGTSQAAPAAASVAALIWSTHPEWSRDQVATQLLGTCDSIDGQNPGLIHKLGAGRVNAMQALTGTARLSRVVDAIWTETHRGRVRIQGVFDVGKVNQNSAWRIRTAGSDGVYSTPDDDVVPVELESPYRVGSNQVFLKSSIGIESDRFRLEIKKSHFVDPFGRTGDLTQHDQAGGWVVIEDFGA